MLQDPEKLQNQRASASTPAAPVVQGAPVAPAATEEPNQVLGRNSPVEALRTRLKELRKQGTLDAAISGTKQVLWERLVKCEVLLGEKMRIKAAVEDRQKRIQVGVEQELPKSLKFPEKPDL